MTEVEILKELGTPSEIFKKVIDEQYVGYENEPDFFHYFSEQELKEKVLIKVLKWEKKREVIMVWLKRNGDEWLSFSVIKYDPNRQVY